MVFGINFDPSAIQRAASNAFSAQQQQSPVTKFSAATAMRPAYISALRQPEPAGPQGPTPAPAAPPPPQVQQQPVTAQQAAAQQPAQQAPMQYQMGQGPAIRRQLGMPYQTGYYMPQQSQMQQPAQSVTQQASRGGAQSVSNYMSALRQAGAGTNNAMMNAPNQLGAGPQAGFMGFGQNGIQTQLGGQFVGPQQMQTGLSFQNNMASAGPNYFAGNQAYSPGLMQARGPRLANTGGISTVNGPGLLAGAQNAPQFTIPQPWLNPQNTPRDSGQWEGYFFQDPSDEDYYNPDINPNNPKQSGSFYSNQFESTSDERAKTNIAPATNELEDFMNQLGVYSYEYKNKEHGEGRYISPMAQEFEKSKLGQQAVVTDPETGLKKVNYGKLMGVNTAALALVNHKLNKLEAEFKKAIKTNIKSKRTK